MKSSAELRRELAEAEAREQAAIKAKKNATPPKFSFWILPANHDNEGRFSFGRLYDPTCHLYTIERRCENKEAAIAAGWLETDMREGNATYVFNVVTRRVICAVGGGTVYISHNRPYGAEDYADDAAFFTIGNFLAEFPAGGEITWVYEQYRAERKEAVAAVEAAAAAAAANNGHPAKA